MDEDYARKLRAWLRAEPEATPRRAAEEREWLREVPSPADGGRAADDRPATSAPQPEPERWTVRGQLPAEQPDADDEWVCPVIVLPVPRSSRENGCRMSEAQERSRRNHPSGRLREEAGRPQPLSEPESDQRSHPEHASGSPQESPEPRRMSEAEARSRWNHPSNWHRRRAAEQRPGTEADEPGSR